MADALVKELGVEDLYGFLNVSSTATEKEITKAYRKQALKYHPDKNPDDTTAVAMFQKLSRIYNVLLDPAAKAAYDKWLKAREMVKKRNEELTTKRRKMKEALESRESEHYATVAAELEAQRLMRREIERLRELGQEMIQKQEEILRQTLHSAQEEEAVIQVIWKEGSYTHQDLWAIFTKYGSVEQILPSKKKNKALISFSRVNDAVKAVEDLSGSSFQISWISGEPVPLVYERTDQRQKEEPSSRGGAMPYFEEARKRPSSVRDNERTCEIDIENYESAVLERLRQAQQKKTSDIKT